MTGWCNLHTLWLHLFERYFPIGLMLTHFKICQEQKQWQKNISSGGYRGRPNGGGGGGYQPFKRKYCPDFFLFWKISTLISPFWYRQLLTFYVAQVSNWSRSAMAHEIRGLVQWNARGVFRAWCVLTRVLIIEMKHYELNRRKVGEWIKWGMDEWINERRKGDYPLLIKTNIINYFHSNNWYH